MSGTYVPLARKWRPRTFADVVGQEETVRALTNAVSQDRLAHAYLFSGPRGVGKTTNARLLAAAINCHGADHPTPTPCGRCESCTEIFEGRSIDALEIDGATHGKVDQARDLVEIVSYAPVRDRRKIFIIDEVHAISSAAFQALLKTLEEPPGHAVFILATTERHKIPATILSRCQRFDFRRLTDAEVAERLAEVARREGWRVEGGGDKGTGASGAGGEGPFVERAALTALAAASTGSLRDGLSLFDQAVARSGGNVTAADVSALLGAPDRSALIGLLTAVLRGDRAAVLRCCSELEAAGADPRTTLHDLTALVRGTVRLAADPGAVPPAGLSEAAAAQLEGFARVTSYETLLRLLSLLVESDGLLRRSDVPALAFEVLVLRLAELPRLVPLEDLLSGRVGMPAAAALTLEGSDGARGAAASAFRPGGPGEVAFGAAATTAAAAGGSAAAMASVPGPGSRASGGALGAPRAGSPMASPAVAGEPSVTTRAAAGSASAGVAPAPPAPPAAAARSRVEEHEPRFVGLTPFQVEADSAPGPDASASFRAAVEKRHGQLGAVLEDATITVDGKRVRIVFDPPNPIAERRLSETTVFRVLEDAATSLLGRGATVAVEAAEPAAASFAAAAAEADPQALETEHLRRKVASDERVRRVLDLFEAEVVDVRKDEG